jgi:hypothetical protein
LIEHSGVLTIELCLGKDAAMEVLPDDRSHGAWSCCKLAASAAVELSVSSAAAAVELVQTNGVAIELVAGTAMELILMAGTDMKLELAAAALELESSSLAAHKCSVQFPHDSNGARHPRTSTIKLGYPMASMELDSALTGGDCGAQLGSDRERWEEGSKATGKKKRVRRSCRLKWLMPSSVLFFPTTCQSELDVQITSNGEGKMSDVDILAERRGASA